jgi:hypothetical protein
MIYGYFTLFVALVISAIAEYYSIIGLTAIFSAAFWPVVIMGAALGVGKLTAAVWLKLNWDRASWPYKLYLVPAVAFLMVLTSLGCFGYLSKAHSDQSLVSGDSMAKVAIYDEKIKTAKDNIDTNRTALKQMDAAVDQVMGRSNDEKGADKAVSIRRSQSKERTRLLAEIEVEQKKVAALSEERAPYAAEFRRIENEVGPIKYIAALIYGDNPDANILEKAVRLVIMLIVAVFDPLALVLILAAQQSIKWARGEEQTPVEVNKHTQTVVDNNTVGEPHESTPPVEEQTVVDECAVVDAEHTAQSVSTESTTAEDVDLFAYLKKPFVHFSNLPPMVYKREVVDEEDNTRPLTEEEVMAPAYEEDDGPLSEEQVAQLIKSVEAFKAAADAREPEDDTAIEPEVGTQRSSPEILALGIDEIERPGDYITPPEYTGPMKEIVEEHIDPNTRIKTLSHSWVPDLDAHADNIDRAKAANADFGTKFPESATKGDMYLRVDFLPARLFKFNGVKWIEVDKAATDSYTYNEEYIKYLIDKINSGEYDVDTLSESEQEQIREYLKKQ